MLERGKVWLLPRHFMCGGRSSLYVAHHRLTTTQADVEVGWKRHFHPDPPFVDGTPCFTGGQFGYIDKAICVGPPRSPYNTAHFHQAIVDINVNLKRHHHEPLDGSPCWEGGRRGRIQDSLCLVVSFT
jgi:hypothetical protein